MWLLYSPSSQGAPKGLEASRFSALVHFLRRNTTRTQLWLEQQDTFRQLRTEPRLPNGAARLLFTPTLAGLFVRHYHLMIAVNDYEKKLHPSWSNLIQFEKTIVSLLSLLHVFNSCHLKKLSFQLPPGPGIFQAIQLLCPDAKKQEQTGPVLASIAQYWRNKNRDLTQSICSTKTIKDQVLIFINISVGSQGDRQSTS